MSDLSQEEVTDTDPGIKPAEGSYILWALRWIFVPNSLLLMIITEYVPRTKPEAIVCLIRNLLSQEVNWLWTSNLVETDAQITSLVSVAILGKFVELSCLVREALIVYAYAADDILVTAV